MKNTGFIIGVFLLISCGNNTASDKESGLTPRDTLSENAQTRDNSHNQKVIEPDFFSIPNSEFVQFESDPSQWFISRDGKDKLYFLPYTDYSITTAILTKNEIQDTELLDLLTSGGILFKNPKKAIVLNEVTSNLGIKLGLSIHVVTKIFGEPNTENELKNGKHLIWNFTMLESKTNNSTQMGGLKPFILNGLEFNVKMTFVDDVLTEVVYTYEVP